MPDTCQGGRHAVSSRYPSLGHDVPVLAVPQQWSPVALAWPPSARPRSPTVITSDGTLGTKVTQQGRVHTITGGTRPQGGPNLFHSFDRFDVGTGDTARFTAANPEGIENILSRVTGGQRSHIDGRIQSDIAGANMFLLNPSGVLFGPNASLDVPGSFHVSTADVLRFSDGYAFRAVNRPEPLLTVAAPAAFGFIRPHPAAITIRAAPYRSRLGRPSRSLEGTSRSQEMASSTPSARHSVPRAGRSPW